MIRREPFEYEEDEYRDEEVYTPNFDTQPIESPAGESRRTSSPYDDYEEDDAENAPTLTPAHKWLQFRKTARNGFESPPAAQNSMTSLTSETSYSPRQLVPLDTYNYNDTIETDSAVDMGSHVADSPQQSTPHARRQVNDSQSNARRQVNDSQSNARRQVNDSQSNARRQVNDSQSNARRQVNDSQSTLHSGRHMNLRSDSKTISNATTTAVSNGVSGTVSNGVNGRAPADVAEEIFARRKVKASRVAKAAWEFVEGPQFEEMITKKLPTDRVDLRELRDFQLKVSRLPSSSDVVVRGMQKLLREQSELMAGLGIMVDGLMVRSEQLRHESQRYQRRYAEEICRKKLPERCRDGISARNLTHDWVMKERPPFKGMDLRKLLERWRPHCRCSDQNYYAHAIDLMRHYFSDACHPEDAIKKYSIRSHGNAGRSAALISVPERIVSFLIDFVLDALGLGHEDLLQSVSRARERSSRLLFGGSSATLMERTIAFHEMQDARADWSLQIRKAMSRALTEVRAYSFVAEGVPLAPKGNKKIVRLPS